MIKIFYFFQSDQTGGSAVVVEGRKTAETTSFEENPMPAHTSMKKFLITAAAVAISSVGLAACSNDSAATPTKSSETSTEKSSEESSDKMSSEKATSESTSGDKMEHDKMGHDDKMTGDSDKMSQ